MSLVSGFRFRVGSVLESSEAISHSDLTRKRRDIWTAAFSKEDASLISYETAKLGLAEPPTQPSMVPLRRTIALRRAWSRTLSTATKKESVVLLTGACGQVGQELCAAATSYRPTQHVCAH